MSSAVFLLVLTLSLLSLLICIPKTRGSISFFSGPTATPLLQTTVISTTKHPNTLTRDPVSAITLCIRYSFTKWNTPVCIGTLQFMGFEFGMIHSEEYEDQVTLSVRGFINGSVGHTVMKEDYKINLNVTRSTWASPDNASNNMIICFTFDLSKKMTFYMRTEEFGPLSPQNGTFGAHRHLNIILPTAKERLERLVKVTRFPLTTSIGCSKEFLQTVKISNGILRQYQYLNSRPTVVRILDLNVYLSRKSNGPYHFTTEDFIHEVSCQRVRTPILTLNAFIKDLEARTDFGKGVYIENGIPMLCRGRCTVRPHRSHNMYGPEECLLKQIENIHDCHRRCFKLPVSLQQVQYCLNCIVYFVDCPVVKDLGESLNTADVGNMITQLEQRQLVLIKPTEPHILFGTTDTCEELVSQLQRLLMRIASRNSAMIRSIRKWVFTQMIQIPGHCRNNTNYTSVIMELDAEGHRVGRKKYEKFLLNLGNPNKKTGLPQPWISESIECYSQDGCFKEHVDSVTEVCCAKFGVETRWAWEKAFAIHPSDEVMCSKFLQIYYCIEHGIGRELAMHLQNRDQRNVTPQIMGFHRLLKTIIILDVVCFNDYNTTITMTPNCRTLANIAHEIWQKNYTFSTNMSRTVDYLPLMTYIISFYTTPGLSSSTPISVYPDTFTVTAVSGGPRDVGYDTYYLILMVVIGGLLSLLLLILMTGPLWKCIKRFCCKPNYTDFVLMAEYINNDDGEVHFTGLCGEPRSTNLSPNPFYSGSLHSSLNLSPSNVSSTSDISYSGSINSRTPLCPVPEECVLSPASFGRFPKTSSTSQTLSSGSATMREEYLTYDPEPYTLDKSLSRDNRPPVTSPPTRRPPLPPGQCAVPHTSTANTACIYPALLPVSTYYNPLYVERAPSSPLSASTTPLLE